MARHLMFRCLRCLGLALHGEQRTQLHALSAAQNGSNEPDGHELEKLCHQPRLTLFCPIEQYYGHAGTGPSAEIEGVADLDAEDADALHLDRLARHAKGLFGRG